jgi:hypothetical protein
MSYFPYVPSYRSKHVSVVGEQSFDLVHDYEEDSDEVVR